jgi:hypothetical protein
MATPKPRTSPGINQSTVNKNYKNTSNSSSYFGNVGKEFKDFVRVYNATTEMANTSGPGTDAAASRLRNQQDKEFGQLMGALIGKRYNSKGIRTR